MATCSAITPPPSRRRRPRRLHAAVLLAVLLLCDGSAPLLAADELVIYAGRSDRLLQPLIDAFALESGTSVVLQSGQAADLLDKLQRPGADGNADIFISNDAGQMQAGDELQLFAVLPEELLTALPGRFRAASNTWCAVALRLRVLAFNRQFRQDHPLTSVFDLRRPEVKGQVALVGGNNESVVAGMTTYLQLLGEEDFSAWLRQLRANTGNETFSKHTYIVKALAQGQKGVGLVNHFDFYQHLQEYPQDPLEIVIPDQGENGKGAAWNVAGIALTRRATQREKALAFIRFVLSAKGQEVFTAGALEYPLLPAAKSAAVLPPLNTLKLADVPMEQVGKLRQHTLQLLRNAGLP